MLAEEHSIPFFETPLTNSSRTKKIFHSLDLDLGLSLGNGYISRGVFSIPKFGMINLHTERLPEYRGGHSVLCPILEGETTSGFTIHQIDSGIDTGEIIYKKIVPIEFSPNLKKTVKNTLSTILAEVPSALVKVCREYTFLRRESQSQDRGNTYTTPTFWEYCKIVHNHKKMYELYVGKK